MLSREEAAELFQPPSDVSSGVNAAKEMRRLCNGYLAARRRREEAEAKAAGAREQERLWVHALIPVLEAFGKTFRMATGVTLTVVEKEHFKLPPLESPEHGKVLKWLRAVRLGKMLRPWISYQTFSRLMKERREQNLPIHDSVQVTHEKALSVLGLSKFSGKEENDGQEV